MKPKRFAYLAAASAIILLLAGRSALKINGMKAPASQPVQLIPSTPNEPAPTAESQEIVRLMFTGDMNLGRCVAKEAILNSDYTFPFHHVSEKLSAADITIGSLDGSISDQAYPEPCPSSMNLIGPEGMALGLEYAGFDVITTATNHIKDCGSKGFSCNNHAMLDTMKTLKEHNIISTGTGADLASAREPAFIEAKGIRFAFIGVNQIDARVWASENKAGTAPLEEQWIGQIEADIRAAKEKADVVIVLPQWGIEYAPRPEPYQRDWARTFIDAGATLVVGNHPHIVQPVEQFENGAAFYALGNFVFDQKQDYRREGVVLEAVFKGDELQSWTLHPVLINYFSYQPEWVSGTNAEEILQRAATIQ